MGGGCIVEDSCAIDGVRRGRVRGVGIADDDFLNSGLVAGAVFIVYRQQPVEGDIIMVAYGSEIVHAGEAIFG